jgi:GNAT superfamily N-acetyltransferase
MTAAWLLKSAPPDGLQPVDLGRHLGGIAELIELCFSGELDSGARSLIREMRWLSHAGPALRVMQVLTAGQPWNAGYVWVERGRVVGTVSTQPAPARAGGWLVANVAVHPAHRRRGIAQALMRATLDLIRGHGGSEAILQVDADNLGALALYRGLGFLRITTQTTWIRSGHLAPPPFAPPPLPIHLRRSGEWAAELALAQEARPEGLAWGRPLAPGDFRPAVLKTAENLLTGRSEEHWVAPAQAGNAPAPLAGALIVQLGSPDGDRLIPLVHPHYRGQLERALLLRGLRRLGRRPWPARVEYRADDEHATQALHQLGFAPHRTLCWMRFDLRRDA